MPEFFSHLTTQRFDPHYDSMNSRLYFECQDFVDDSFGERKEEMIFFAPQPTDRQLEFAPSFSNENNNNIDTQVYTKDELHEPNGGDLNLSKEGFSLGLNNQTMSFNEIGSCENRYMNSGETITTNYLSFDSSQSGVTNDFNVGSTCNKKSDQNIKQDTVVDDTIYSSKYIKAVQELLDELVNVHRCLNPTKNQLNPKQYKCNYQSVTSLNPHKSSFELSTSENDLCNKLSILLSLLDEVDRKYNKYCQQMLSVVSSFESMVGLGGAKSYTKLAQQTISHQFRNVFDAIKRQIQVVDQSLGEKGNIFNSQGARLSRLRQVDQQVRQERVLQQFGMVRQPWRPQRGLPETAVSVLRAWLFEHFLHPYPKDSEKIMLARKAGLTRSQVANWFINARVRLWKPMIEEMYKAEVSNINMDSNSSESQKPAKRLKSELEDTGEVLHESFNSIVSNNIHMGMVPCESRNNINSSDGFEVNYIFDEKMGFELNTSCYNEIIDVADERNINDNQHINSSVKTDYFCMDFINIQKDRVYNSNMVSHFVI